MGGLVFGEYHRVTKNKLDPEKIKLLESLPQWSWNALEDRWNEGFEILKQYAKEYGHAKIPNRFKYKNFNLGNWTSRQRKEKDNISSERIKKLESLPGWVWRVKSE